MMLPTMVLMVCTLPVGVVCIYLVLHREYEDGFIGRIGLALISIAAFARFATTLGGGDFPITTIGLVLWIGVALFFVRHWYRFVNRSKRHPYLAQPRETAGKRRTLQ